MKLYGEIFEYFGFIFYFFSNEHEPIHVHVKKGGEECIFDLVIENGELIRVEKWVTFFVYRQEISNTKINKKIK